MRRTFSRFHGLPAFRNAIFVGALGAAAAGCSHDAPAGPGTPDPAGLLVLNSTGQTLAPFFVGTHIQSAGRPIDLGPAFDGQAVDALGEVAVSTVSSFGGSLVVFADLQSGEVAHAVFPAPEGAEANPSAPTFDEVGAVWLAGRGSDAVYRLEQGSTTAVRVASGIGRFVERVVPVGDLLYAIDANLDDDGLTYQPVGPGRVLVLTTDGTIVDEIVFPEGVVNAFDAVVAGGDLIVLATGSFGPDFQPVGDGNLVIVSLADASVRAILPLQANGIWLELGENGDVYATTTSDFVSTEVVRYDPQGGAFVNAPGSGIEVLDASEKPVTCAVATGLIDDRVLCATFSFAESGRLILSNPEGSFIDEIPSGFGSRDLLLR